MSTDGLFLGSLLLSEAGFDAAADVLKHALSAFGIGAGRLQFQILVKSFLCSWCGNYFACLIGSSLSYQVNSLLIIRIRFVGISGNGFIECGDGFIILTAIGKNSTFVVIVLCGSRRIQLSSFVI